MSRETHVRFCERAVVKLHRATRLIVFNAEHLRSILAKYAAYYNEVRTHLALQKDAPRTRRVELVGDIIAQPILGGLHQSVRADIVFESDTSFNVSGPFSKVSDFIQTQLPDRFRLKGALPEGSPGFSLCLKGDEYDKRDL